jgi:hypothetical protein
MIPHLTLWDSKILLMVHCLLVQFQERNFAAAGLENWHRAVYLPTSSDTMVIAFRRWFREHCKNQIGWPATTVDQFPPTPTKDKLMDRY